MGSKKKEWFLNTTLAILVVCALLVTGLAMHREFFSDASSIASHPQVIPEWRNFAEQGHRMGPPNAPVTIVEFSDFQCPFCGRLAKQLQQLHEEYPNEVAVVYRHFPLPMHPYALPAVRASECAAAQGRFAAFHDVLFAAQDSLGTVPWERFATQAGVADLAAFRQCDSSTEEISALARDTLAGRRLGVSATPTLLINDLRVVGAPPMARLETYVRDALRDQRANQ